MTRPNDKPALLIADGPGGPTADWYLPRLSDRFNVHVLWRHSGNQVSDQIKSDLFARFCTASVIESSTPMSDALLEVAARRQVNGVLSFSERTATDVHVAAEKLGLPGTPADAARRLQSKLDQRRQMMAAGIPTPAFRAIESLEDLRKAAEQIGKPCVLKPQVGVGSASVHPVEPGCDLSRLWQSVEESYLADPRGTGTRHFVLEERLIGTLAHPDSRFGDQVSVESLVQNGATTHLAVTDKLPLVPVFRETADITPSTLPETLLKEIRSLATAAITTLGLDNCAVHTEMKLTADGPRVIEVNGRVGGGVTQMLHYAADFDIVSALADIATGVPARIQEPLKFRRCAAYLTPQPPVGVRTVSKAPSQEDLMAIEGVVSAQVLKRTGDPVDWRIGTAAQVAAVYATGDTPAELIRINQSLNSPSLFDYEWETDTPGNLSNGE
ncbi:acetyl-CoA carboxylase biotin carboxylase subunit family protein [Streptomyces sp. PBH53]|uniref:ATP-grasp domain-containing protein n=1 Tax=Streptomyces sp. PBH53 TaxID=1577075 RepID=UPI000AC1E860|nr:ATP-grasp domain-containing protein [Streptomyces sp. PBH53]